MRKAVFFNLTQIQMPVDAVTSTTPLETGVLEQAATAWCLSHTDAVKQPIPVVWHSDF